MKIEKFSEIKNYHCVRVSFFFFWYLVEVAARFSFFVAQDNNKGDRLLGPPPYRYMKYVCVLSRLDLDFDVFDGPFDSFVHFELFLDCAAGMQNGRVVF